MKSGYDNFFKQARSNASKGTKTRLSAPKETKVKRSGKKELADYSESELRSLFKMNDQGPKSKRRGRRSKEKMGISAWGGIITAVLMGLSIIVFIFPDEINDWINRVEFHVMGQAGAADQEKNSAKETAAAEENSPDQKQVDAKSKSVTDKEEVKDLSYFGKLNDRKKQLDLRERELEELEQELNKQKVEIEARIQYLETVRRDIAGVLKDRVEVDQEKVNKLVEFYSNMKPAQAAEIISNLNEELAIGVLSNMKKKNAAAILNMIEPKKAKKLSEKFAGYIKE